MKVPGPYTGANPARQSADGRSHVTRHRRSALMAVPLGVGLIAGVGGCSSEAAQTQELTVFAASSLAEVFSKLAGEFEAAHPGVRVQMVFGASSSLARQINDGAPADVFAAASPETMSTVIDARHTAGVVVPFATNTLAVVTPESNPGHVTNVGDLANPKLKVVLCATQVPCGATADMMLRNARVNVTPASREPDVKSVLAKVVNGEADAGVVYATDALVSTATTETVAIPAGENVTTTYEIANLQGTAAEQLAAEWIAFVRRPQSQTELRAAGFGTL